MQLVGIFNLRPRLVAHGGDGLWVEPSDLVRRADLPARTRLHGAGSALFERRIIEEGIRAHVQNFVRERRRLDGIARE